MDQTINIIWFPSPDMQFAIFLIHGRALPQLICRQVDPVSAAIGLIVGYRLCTPPALGYREIANPRHNSLCSVVIFIIVPRNRKSTKITILRDAENIILAAIIRETP